MPNHESKILPAFRMRALLRSTPVLALLTLGLILPAQLGAQVQPEIVGHVEGQDFRIEAQPGLPLPSGPSTGLLASGSRLIVRAGQAQISLNGGGEIIICGAARLQLLKSQGALTVALDYGTLRIRVDDAESLSVFTPQVMATPIAIGGGSRETTIGLEHNGQMCLRALSGAVRISQPLSGESLLVPQYGGLSLSGGQLNPVAAAAPGCACDLDTAKLLPLKPIPARETSGVGSLPAADLPSQTQSVPLEEKPRTLQGTKEVAAPPVLPRDSVASDAAAPPSVDTPIYHVLMPPLTFNAANPTPPPDPSPDTMILVRTVRAREETVFSGTVEPKSAVAAPPTAQKDSSASSAHSGILARIGGFFRRVFGVSTGPGCEGAGCR